MQALLKNRPVWAQFLFFIGIALCVFTIFALVGTVVMMKITGLSVQEVTDIGNWDMQDTRLIAYIRGMLLFQFLGLFLIPVFIFSSLVNKNPYRYLGLTTPTLPLYFFLGILIMVAAIPLAGWLGQINRQLPLSPSLYEWVETTEKQNAIQAETLLNQHSISQLLLNLLFIAVFAGIGEELLFRGVIQRLLIRWFRNPWAGIWVTAILFSAFHFQFLGFLPRILLGVLLGAIYWYSGNLWTAILAHFFYDGLIVAASYANPSLIKDDTAMNVSGVSLIVQGTISLLAVISILYLMRKRSTNSFAKIYADENANPPIS